ncbi:hypothetical protein P608_21965 [Comamonas thiooxydans]|uniref:Uncharacterized protein n=1 Tax=Comamonas thiooxydans TaxID=363952 RepID=A0A0E3CCI4_9BURK|nr:hypothetical protein P608_21965 [Comamonas thiooxydans]KGH20046.1 hypothetical protein P607_10255 [Comamonas thiooxydans]
MYVVDCMSAGWMRMFLWLMLLIMKNYLKIKLLKLMEIDFFID